MSLVSNKKNIFDTISSIKSFGENDIKTSTNNTLNSISNSKDSLGFLMDICIVLLGGYGLFKIIGSIFGNVFDTSKPILNNQLKNISISPLSNKQIQETNFDEIILPVKDIDINNKLRTDPNNDIGKLIYGENNINSFDYKLYETINNPNTTNTINNIDVLYNNDDDTLKITPNKLYQITNDFYDEYIYENDDISKNEFITNIFDNMFGIKNKGNNKNKIIEKLKTNKKIEHIINDDEIDLKDDEINDIENQSDLLSKGIVEYDWVCKKIQTNIDIVDFSDFVNIVNNLKDNESISNEFENMFKKTYNSNNNIDTAKNKFNTDIIKNFELEMVNSFVLTPKYIILNNIIEKINNNSINNNINDYLYNNKKTIQCVSNKAKNEINKEIFNIAKTELNSLIKPFVKRIMNEKINQYTNIIKSLASLS